MSEVMAQEHKQSKWSMVGKDPYSMPIEKIDLSHPGIWQAIQFLPFLERLRSRQAVVKAISSALRRNDRGEVASEDTSGQHSGIALPKESKSR